MPGSRDTQKRKAHVKRIYQVVEDDGNGGWRGSTGNGDGGSTRINHDVWVDVLRIDNLYVLYRGLPYGTAGMGVTHKFKWDDDPNNFNFNGDLQQENANPNRKTSKTKVKNPDDTSQFINLWTIDRARIVQTGGLQPGDGGGGSGQTVNWNFNNTPFTESKHANRTTSFVTIMNNDLGGNDGPDMTQGLMDWESIYLPALQNGKVDNSQKLDVEMVDNFSLNFGVSAIDSSAGQGIKVILGNNKQIENLFFRSDPNVDLPPLRLDPLQIIVNVSWLRCVWFAWANSYGTHFSTSYELNCFCDPTQAFPDIPPEDFPPGFGYFDITGASEIDTELGSVYRSEDGLKWERIDLSSVFNNGITRIDNFNGYLIAQGSMATVEDVANIITCSITYTDPNNPPPSQPPPPFVGPCDGGGTFVNFGVAAMKSQDQGKTWTLIDSSFDHSGVAVTYDKDIDPTKITVTFFGGDGSDPIDHEITTPWKIGEIRKPEPFPFRGPNGGVGNTHTVVRSTLSSADPGAGGVLGFISTIETSTDGGKTFKTTLSLSDTVIVGPTYMRPSGEALKVRGEV
jgi:hypothetical protein